MQFVSVIRWESKEIIHHFVVNAMNSSFNIHCEVFDFWKSFSNESRDKYQIWFICICKVEIQINNWNFDYCLRVDEFVKCFFYLSLDLWKNFLYLINYYSLEQSVDDFEEDAIEFDLNISKICTEFSEMNLSVVEKIITIYLIYINLEMWSLDRITENSNKCDIKVD